MKIFLSVLFVVVLQTVGSNAVCDDYFPCSCDESPEGDLYVTCNQISANEIQAVLNRTTARDVFSFSLIPAPSTTVFPADLLSGRRVQSVNVSCASNSYQLRMDAAALQASSDYTAEILISYCDLGLLDYSFLSGFNKLNYIRIESCNKVETIQTFPLLDGLGRLTITDSNGLGQLNQFPSQSLPNLQAIKFNGNQINDQKASLILSAIASSPSVGILEAVMLENNQLTRIPSEIPLFPKLYELGLSVGNRITTVPSASLSFTAQVAYLFLNSIAINVIQPGAFQGDLGSAEVMISNNSLKTVEEGVFKVILEQMLGTGIGVLYLDANPFECGCDLAWLIRDNRYLLQAVSGATCSNGTNFELLNPTDFNNCP